MKYKILCSDLDGTLLSTKSDVSQFTISEIKRIAAYLKVILVSARMPQSMHYLQKELNILEQPIICYNGALIMDGTKKVFSEVIAFEALNRIHILSEQYHIKLGLYYEEEWYAEGSSERIKKEMKHTKTTPYFRSSAETLQDWGTRKVSAHKIMLMGTKASSDTIYPILEKELGHQILCYRSNDTLIEIAPKSVSKLSAIQMLLSKNESLADVISFGDNYNDVEMLKHSGTGVAVGNAREEVKAIADYITLQNTEDGVAHFIKQHL